MRIRNITSAHGNKIANQFIIEDGNKVYFQSYNSMIACIDYNTKTITIGEDYNYSVTTGKYRNKFFDDMGFDEIATLAKLDKALKNKMVKIGICEIEYTITLDVNL